MLSHKFLRRYKDAAPPWGEVGYITYKRTYARMVEDIGRTEEWFETCQRAVNGLVEIGGVFREAELERLFDRFFYLKGLCSGRALWQLGSNTIRKVGSDSMQNCWHVIINNLEAFCFTFNQLMLGGGVGFNIMPENVYELPHIKTGVSIKHVNSYDCDFIVPDNREGWVELLRRVLHCFFITGHDLTYCTRAIRAQGLPIETFGGTASGSEPLIRGMGQIVEILKSREGRKLRPIDCLDVENVIGTIVVAGNVRRSSEIACGSVSDLEFANAKNWKLKKVPNWRAMSNNSFMESRIANLPDQYWETLGGEGEVYGLINPHVCKHYGRLADGLDYRQDLNFAGVNPCGEITLENKEPCNLAEIFVPNIENEDEFEEIAELLYKVTKTISCIKFSDPETQEVVSRNHRLGIGLTGFVEATHLHDEQIFDNVYKHIEGCDREYSKLLDVPLSKKLTTIKPSGTMSLLAGVTPGAHNGYSEFVIRRIRFSGNDPLVDICREYGYHVEPLVHFDGTRDHNTMVIEFPAKYKAGIPTDQAANAVAQLERQKWLQTHWADNSVSMTVYYRPDEAEGVKNWLLANYDSGVKCTSYLRHEGHGFRQAPLEPITEQQYWELRGSTLPITELHDTEELEFLDSHECGKGGCPIK